MANNKKGNLWILIMVCMGCIIISTVAYVVMKARMQSEFLAITIPVAVAITLCVCAWQIFTQLENLVPKSERIKAEKLAEEARTSVAETRKIYFAKLMVFVQKHAETNRYFVFPLIY